MVRDIHEHRILILDFGSQYTQLIARRIREIGVYCEIWPWDSKASEISHFAPRGIILSGGPESVHADDGPQAPAVVFELNIPVLGICYGLHTMAAQLGGRVEPSELKEFGFARVTVEQPSRLLQNIEDHVDAAGQPQLDVWMSHGDKVVELPPGFERVASTDSAPLCVIADDGRGFYGVQFHPEVTHTVQGERILERFVHEICGCEENWTAENIIRDTVSRVREQVGDDHVILGLSGGVDSSVVAALLHQAIGDQLTCIFVDTGMLRYGEGDQVMATFARHMGVRVIRVDAKERFLGALRGIADPEEKRKVIGNMFIEVFEEEAGKIDDARWLAQGTIYPDVIESAGAKTGKAQVIKSHHNVGGLPDYMKLKLVEPLRELFKDEVRRIGVELGLP
ncbi:MAG: glutamine-hydrolyzing GMP synthase, partial [Lysobacterales bacterium]